MVTGWSNSGPLEAEKASGDGEEGNSGSELVNSSAGGVSSESASSAATISSLMVSSVSGSSSGSSALLATSGVSQMMLKRSSLEMVGVGESGAGDWTKSLEMISLRETSAVV